MFLSKIHTIRNVQEFTKFLCYKSNVKFDDIYDVCKSRYHNNAKNFGKLR